MCVCGLKSILISGAFIIQEAIKVSTENGSFNQTNLIRSAITFIAKIGLDFRRKAIENAADVSVRFSAVTVSALQSFQIAFYPCARVKS